ncbi:hypothetical protein [Serratia ficaria]|uniref:hypothetical protein n=1 Tax=Serratia ficaria TaxID=61651 RepID=UPI002182802F|nr:hypothetical protein [Serratia ficaria]CAI2493183.1 Uncharacterised protein [Serratia ficaria]
MKKYLLLSLLPLACSTALAAKTASTDVNFSGEIYNNTSCSITTTANSVELGRHSSEIFQKEMPTELEGGGAGSIPFAVNCSAPTNMGIEVVSASGDSDFQMMDGNFTASLAKSAEGKDIAVLGLVLNDVAMDGEAVSAVMIPEGNDIHDLNNATQGADKGQAIFTQAVGNRFAVTTDAKYDQLAVGQNLNGTFNYRSFLTPLSYIGDKSIQMQDSIPLQASVNFSVHYL